MFDAEIINKLCELGLTIKQAKIYLSTVISKASNVSDISKKTGIHQQDIYKILPKLEKMGLLTKSITKPVTIEPIPIEKALANLIAMQKQKIKNYEQVAGTIIAALKNKQLGPAQMAEDRIIILPRESNALKNMVAIAFKNCKKEYCLLITTEKMYPQEQPFNHINKIVKHGVDVRMVVGRKVVDKLVKDFEKIKFRSTLNITIKSVDIPSELCFALVDDEVWLPLEHYFLASELVTKNKNVVTICREFFERIWKDPEALTIFHQEYDKKASKNAIQSSLS